MIIKEDLKEVKERMSAWWDHEIIDRPVLAYQIPEGPGADKALIDSSPINFELAKNWEGIDNSRIYFVTVPFTRKFKTLSINSFSEISFSELIHQTKPSRMTNCQICAVKLAF